MKKDILKKIISLGQKKNFKAQKILFEEGSLARELCYVIKGRLGIEKEITPGRHIRILTISKGEFSGEAALFAKARRLARVVALEPSQVLFIPRDKFMRFLDKNPRQGLDVFIFMFKDVLSRAGHANRQISCFYQLSHTLGGLGDIREFIETTGKLIRRAFEFKALGAYFFNAVTQGYEPVYQEGLENEDVRIPQESDYSRPAQEKDPQKYGVKKLKYLFLLAQFKIKSLKSCNRLTVRRNKWKQRLRGF